MPSCIPAMLAALAGTGCYIVVNQPAPPPQPVIGMESAFDAAPAAPRAYAPPPPAAPRAYTPPPPAAPVAPAAPAAPEAYRPPPPPPPARPSYGPPAPAARQKRQTFSFGASAGFLATADSEYEEGLSTGGMWNLQASLWLSDIMALQVDHGFSTLDDQDSPLGGDMQITPVSASLVFSLPDPWTVNSALRYRLGVGLGVAQLHHTEYEVDDIPIFRMIFGAEWMLQQNGRLFVAADIMVGEEVEDVSSTWWWDLSSMSCLRLGLEFGF
jgi:hypothetical protein